MQAIMERMLTRSVQPAMSPDSRCTGQPACGTSSAWRSQRPSANSRHIADGHRPIIFSGAKFGSTPCRGCRKPNTGINSRSRPSCWRRASHFLLHQRPPHPWHPRPNCLDEVCPRHTARYGCSAPSPFPPPPLAAAQRCCSLVPPRCVPFSQPTRRRRFALSAAQMLPSLHCIPRHCTRPVGAPPPVGCTEMPLWRHFCVHAFPAAR